MTMLLAGLCSQTSRTQASSYHYPVYLHRRRARRTSMAGSGKPPVPRVKYVYIPADINEDIEQREIEVPPGKEVECLLDKLKAHFGGSGTKTPAQRQAQKEALLKQVGPEAAARMDAAMLEAATNLQMVENIALLPNTQEFGFVAVNMYCDDEAQAKELPRNPRASSIAEAAGRLLEVRGDAFLARVFDNENDFERRDFLLSEVSSTAQWVRDASGYARRKVERDGPPGPDGVGSSQRDFLARLQQQPCQGGALGGTVKADPATQITELSPADAEKEAGNAAVRRGDWGVAAERYTAALKLDPDLVPALNNRALAYLKLGRPADAEADATAVLEKEPSNAKALLRRATARSEQGNLSGAAQDAGGVLGLEPTNAAAQVLLSKLHPPAAAAAGESAANTATNLPEAMQD